MAPGLGDRLKEAFKTDSVQKLAELVGRSYQGVDHWIKGRRRLTDEELLKIHALTGCSIHWLLTGEGPKFIPPQAIAEPTSIQVLSPELRAEIRTEVRNEIIDVLTRLVSSDEASAVMKRLITPKDVEFVDSLLQELIPKGLKR